MRPIPVFIRNPLNVALQRADIARYTAYANALENHDQGDPSNFNLALHILKYSDISEKRFLKELGLRDIRTFNHWRTRMGSPDGQTRVRIIKGIIHLLRDEIHRLEHEVANAVSP